jgi:hypothetical protein
MPLYQLLSEEKRAAQRPDRLLKARGMAGIPTAISVESMPTG